MLTRTRYFSTLLVRSSCQVQRSTKFSNHRVVGLCRHHSHDIAPPEDARSHESEILSNVKSGNFLEAEEILRKSANYLKNVRSFNVVIDALAKSNEIGSLQRAESIFALIENLSYKDGGNSCIKPDRFSYNAMIKCLVKCGDDASIRKATEILRKMEHLYRNGNEDVKPNTTSFILIINA